MNKVKNEIKKQGDAEEREKENSKGAGNEIEKLK